MTEYLCTATIDNKTFEFLTVGCVVLNEAIQQFHNFLLEEHDQLLIMASHCEFERVEAYEATIH